jgi:hypothetical protein
MEIPKKLREREINLRRRTSSFCDTIRGLSNRRFLYEKWVQVKGCSKNRFLGQYTYINLNGKGCRTVHNEQMFEKWVLGTIYQPKWKRLQDST